MAKRLSSEKIKERILRFITKKRRFVTIEEVCKGLNISRPTIKKYINELMKEGWLEESR